MCSLFTELQLQENRRQFFGRASTGIGIAALSALLNRDLHSSETTSGASRIGGLPGIPHFAPKAKRVIYLLQSGAPSQVDLLDHKPSLEKLHLTELPDSIRKGQRLTGMTAGQKKFPVVKSPWKFQQHGESGTWLSELLPHMGKVADDICVINSMHTEAINHDPAITFFQSGHQQPGRPSIGAWLSYGLGSETDNLPSFVVLLSKNSFYQAQPLYDRLWGSGFLSSKYQGVKFRSQGDPVLYLSDPAGSSDSQRRALLDRLAKLNQFRAQEIGDPEINTRISQYEMAYRMQTSAPELMEISSETQQTIDLYGIEPDKPSFAKNCLLARRLVERGVRFVQLFHEAWDQHGNLVGGLKKNCQDTDQACAALIQDLKQRGMLDDTLVIWGGEFGRTPMVQGGGNDGRDHHPNAFTMWMAGGGMKPGTTLGESDEFGFNVTRDRVHVRDLHATILHQLGFDHTRLSVKFQGLDQRLTGVEPARVVREIIS
ncbi:MAG: DUF1501 domain-containing protein [Planctomycetales bacterium]|nr:DUF1501 domain-containing protein [Planctomycetales bacterium]